MYFHLRPFSRLPVAFGTGSHLPLALTVCQDQCNVHVLRAALRHYRAPGSNAVVTCYSNYVPSKYILVFLLDPERLRTESALPWPETRAQEAATTSPRFTNPSQSGHATPLGAFLAVGNGQVSGSNKSVD